jgi:hypothetical protein
MTTDRFQAEGALHPQDAEQLLQSNIPAEIMQQRGYRTVTTKAELERLGFSRQQCLVPTLIVPVWNVHGEIALYQHRPHAPRIRDGKAVKYETPTGAKMVLDVPPAVRSQIGDPAVPLFVTEGVKKADAAAGRGLCCIALLGVWNWRGSNACDGKVVLPDWEAVALRHKNGTGREIYIAFDSDVMRKPGVYIALTRLKMFLESRGAEVFLIYLPAGTQGQKVSLDDFFAAGHSVEKLLSLATTRVREPAGEEHEEDEEDADYEETQGGLVWHKPSKEGPVPTRLCNFTARIIADVAEDDGAETLRHFQIEAHCAGRETRFFLPATSFGSLNWVTEHLGARAILYPGFSIRDHCRTAIQQLSGAVAESRVYTHTGWRQVSDRHWIYLHAGGAIGTAAGTETAVRLSSPLDRYSLPEPPLGDSLTAAVRADLAFLDLAADSITFPLLAATYRAVLGDCDFSLYLAGPTGVFKSELAALAQQHFGAGMVKARLPGNWSSTDNALEGLAFAAKDALLVIDEFVPTGAPADVQRLHMKADRVLRAQGNHAARQRMRADGSLRPPRPPRGLIVSTGEDIPLGQSLRARMLIMEISPGTIAAERLSICQRVAAAGDYAQAMAAFLAWLAPRYGQAHSKLRADIETLRAQAVTSGPHRRTPEVIANLTVGLRYFLGFAHEVGAIDEATMKEYWERGWLALGQAAAAQAAQQAASDPAQRYSELLRAAITAGKAHVADPHGNAPPRSGRFLPAKKRKRERPRSLPRIVQTSEQPSLSERPGQISLDNPVVPSCYYGVGNVVVLLYYY